MVNEIDEGRAFWDAHAHRDPLWAILSDPSKRDRRWDVRQFFETGAREISLLFYQLHQLGIANNPRNALDFGCGVGRLTQALAGYADQVVGVDISPVMLRLAEKLNVCPGRIRFVYNPREDLSAFDGGEFDLVYSDIVLQHIRPDLALKYLAEFLRILAPGGVLVFQLPSHVRPVQDQAPVLRAMSDQAYRASLRVGKHSEHAVPPSCEIALEVSLTNMSSLDWSEQQVGLIRLGNHWLDQQERTMLIQDDGRVGLPATVRAGDTCDLSLVVKAPSTAGEYLCEIDLVHEGICWFGDRGSATLRFGVCVNAPTKGEAAPAAAPGRPLTGPPRFLHDDRTAVPLEPSACGQEVAASDDPGPFPMHGIHKDTVVDFLTRLGGELLSLDNDERCGREWVGYRYVFRRRS